MLLRLERLETRDLPATSFLSAGTLTVVGRAAGSTVQATVTGDSVRVLADGVVTLYPAAGVSRLVMLGGQGPNDLNNSTGLPSVVIGGPSADTLQSFGGDDVIFGRGGNDTVYDVLGSNVVDGGPGADRLFVNAASRTLSDRADAVVSFFGDGRTPGAGSVQLVNKVLYITPPDGGSRVLVTGNRGAVTVTTSFGMFAFTGSVRYVGYFGGAGNDTYENATTIPEVAYGGLGGNDVLISGFSAFSFMKGGGGDDVLLGRASRNDLSGNAGADVLIALLGSAVYRADDRDAYPMAGAGRVIL
jgi:Ca2+-binding RTX toxin-like protein